MDAEMLDRLELAARVQAGARRVKDAAVELAMACEACAHEAGEASAWCRGEDAAELAGVSETLGARLADARETARALHMAAWCVADGVVAEAVEAMSPEDRAELADAWAASMTPAEYGALDADAQEDVRERRGAMALPLECLPDMRWGPGTGIPISLLRAWTAQKTPRSPAEAREAGEGTGTRPDASEAPRARPEAGEGMSGVEAVHG